jgi:hypothetical protein
MALRQDPVLLGDRVAAFVDTGLHFDQAHRHGGAGYPQRGLRTGRAEHAEVELSAGRQLGHLFDIETIDPDVRLSECRAGEHNEQGRQHAGNNMAQGLHGVSSTSTRKGEPARLARRTTLPRCYSNADDGASDYRRTQIFARWLPASPSLALATPKYTG